MSKNWKEIYHNMTATQRSEILLKMLERQEKASSPFSIANLIAAFYDVPLSLRLIFFHTVFASVQLAVRPVDLHPAVILLGGGISCCFLIVAYPFIVPKTRPIKAHWV